MTQTIKFTKMEGAGNDYVYIDTFQQHVSNPDQLAIDMSRRSYGIGSDGMVLIGPSPHADAEMIMRNADGSVSEMCGNAIRCVGKYLYDRQIVPKTEMQIQTGNGVLTVKVKLGDDGKVRSALVSMGLPILEGTQIPSTVEGTQIVNHRFEFDGFQLQGTLVSMGNPHLITYVDNVNQAPVEQWGPIIENDPRFPSRINVEFVEVVSSTEVKQRTWERGAGETWACGTGASAVCVAGVLTGKTEAKILNHLTGGDLTLTWPGLGHEVLMEGPATEVFQGTWNVK